MDKVAHAPQENVIGFTDTFAFSEMIFAVATAYMYGLAKLANRLDVLTMVIKMASKASSIFKFLGYASVAINTVANIVINVQKGVSIDRIISDAIVDIGIGVGVIALSTAIGATIGSAVPGIGNLIGAVVGAVIGFGVYIADELGLVTYIKDFVYTIVSEIGNAVTTIVNDIGNFFAGLFRLL